MSKKQLIALADTIRENGNFTGEQIAQLADFCAAQNPRFKRDRWIDYIDGAVGPNGGKIR